MLGESLLDYILSEEERERLPDPLRHQRDAHIDAIRELQTKHPLEDGGESVQQFSGMVINRVIMDAVTRNLLWKKEGEVVKFPTQ